MRILRKGTFEGKCGNSCNVNFANLDGFDTPTYLLDTCRLPTYLKGENHGESNNTHINQLPPRDIYNHLDRRNVTIGSGHNANFEKAI